MNTALLETLYEVGFAIFAVVGVVLLGAFGVLTVMHHFPY